ncbi:MAG: TonB-dependent receptor, partial [Balneolales bacterium]
MKFWIILFGIVSASSLTNAAEPDGVLNGVIRDAANQMPLQGVNIWVESEELGTSSDENGRFKISNLDPGVYAVRFSFIGYSSRVYTDVVIRASRSTRLEVLLRNSTAEEELIVTGGYFNHDKINPVSRNQMNSEEVRRVPGSGQELSRVIHTLPGVASGGEMSQDIMVRGGSPMENGYYIDNIPMPGIQHFEMQNGASNGPIGIVDTELVEDIEFIAGGFSAGYGNHLSSVTDIRYREGSRDRMHVTGTMSMSGFGGKLEGPLPGENGSILISGRRSYLDLIADAVNSQGAPRYGDFQAKAVYDLDANNKITLLNIYGDSEINTTAEEAIEEGWRTWLQMRTRQNTTGLNWRRMHSDRFYSNTSISYSKKVDNTTTRFVQNDSRDFDLNLNQYYADFRNINYWQQSRNNRFEFGLEGNFNKGDYRYYLAEDMMATGFIRNEISRDLDIQGYHSGIFGSWISNPFRSVTTTIGFRGAYTSLNSDFNVDPRLAVSVDLTSRLRFNASAGLFHQQIPYFYLSQNNDFQSLPNLQSRHVITGLDYMLGEDTKLTLEVYDKTYRNLPVQPAGSEQHNPEFVLDGTSIHDELVSDGRAFARGIDLILQKKLAENFYGHITASLYRSRYRDAEGDWQNRDFDVRHLINIIGGYRPNQLWEFSARWSYVGARPYTPIDEIASEAHQRTLFDMGQFNQERMPAHHSLFLRFDRRFFFKNLTLVTFFELWNAYNRKNVRSYYWHINENRVGEEPQFNTLPVGGFEIQF